MVFSKKRTGNFEKSCEIDELRRGQITEGEAGRLGTEGHMSHAADGAQFEVLTEGKGLGVKMPYLKGFREYVRKGVLKGPAS